MNFEYLLIIFHCWKYFGPKLCEYGLESKLYVGVKKGLILTGSVNEFSQFGQFLPPNEDWM